MKRALIDWDFAARGIWTINSPSEESPAPVEGHRSRWSGVRPLDTFEQIRPWSDLLTTSLLDRLQSWNDWGCTLTRPPNGAQFDEPDWETFYRNERELAETTQMELGDHWQVLWAADDAWHFVRFP
jgi:hypothetical protein